MIERETALRAEHEFAGTPAESGSYIASSASKGTFAIDCRNPTRGFLPERCARRRCDTMVITPGYDEYMRARRVRMGVKVLLLA